PPHETSGPMGRVWVVGGQDEEGCANGGVEVLKYVDTLVALPNQTTIFTYIVNVENLQKNSQQIESLKDVLPQAGFQWCDPSNPPLGFTCDPPMYKWRADAFDPQVDSFTDISGYSNANDSQETYDGVDDRWELFWDQGWGMEQAGKPQDNLILRFQAHVTPTLSGSYYNEVFADVDCSAPSTLVLVEEGVTSQAEYCASYSWPTGGVIVPSFDVGVQVGSTTAQGNMDIDWSGGTGDTRLNSWHIN
ncbi:MAG: hypothetical protein V3U31_06265, partial [Dehalococcoidia bacterium]